MHPRTRRIILRNTALALMAVGLLVIVLGERLTGAGWPASIPPATVGSLTLLAGLIVLLSPGRHRPV